MNKGSAESYRIVRFYERGGRRIIARRMTLDEAQEWCKRPDTSSSTATTPEAKRRTARMGRWFDGWESEG